MNAEFNWWLLIVGLVVGAGLVWLVLLDARRREDEVTATERALEASWLSQALVEEGHPVAEDVARRMLELHAEYLATSEPPEPGVVEIEPDRQGSAGVDARATVRAQPAAPLPDRPVPDEHPLPSAAGGEDRPYRSPEITGGEPRVGPSISTGDTPNVLPGGRLPRPSTLPTQ